MASSVEGLESSTRLTLSSSVVAIMVTSLAVNICRSQPQIWPTPTSMTHAIELSLISSRRPFRHASGSALLLLEQIHILKDDGILGGLSIEVLPELGAVYPPLGQHVVLAVLLESLTLAVFEEGLF
jgi:hypothetical protein